MKTPIFFICALLVLSTLSVTAHQQGSGTSLGPTPKPADNRTHQWCWPMGNAVSTNQGHSDFVSWAASSFPSMGFTFVHHGCANQVAPWCNGQNSCDLGLTVDVWMMYASAIAAGGSTGDIAAYNCACYDTTGEHCVRGLAVVDMDEVEDAAAPPSTLDEDDIEKTA